jgi:adenylate cyclase
MIGKKFKQLLWEWRGFLIATPSVALIVILLRFSGLLQSWEWAVYDQFLRMRPQEPRDERIAIVGIDEADITRVGNPVFPDGIYADLLKKLLAMQPLAIGLDIYRDLPVEPGHKELVEIFHQSDKIIGIEKVVGDKNKQTVAPPPALKAKGQVGSNDVIFDGDGRVRRAILSLSDNKGENVLGFGVYLALLYLDKKGISPEVVKGTNNWWKLGKTVFVPFESWDGPYVRADAGGYQTWLNYRGKKNFEIVSMGDILDNKVPPNWGKDRIILIGAVSESFQDMLMSPYTLTPADLMSGIEIHAHIASQLISTALDDRPLIKTWSEPVELAWISLWSGIGATIAWMTRHDVGKGYFFLRRVTINVSAFGSLFLITYLAFLSSWWLPVIPPFLCLSGSMFAITLFIARSAGKIRNTFGRYLSSEIVATLLEHPEGLKLGGERRKITIFTSDLRGFTATSERLTPEEVVRVLNFYLGKMADIITKYQGTIDEFMGDGILVLFGAPIGREDDAQRAIACAIEMQLAMVHINEQMKEWNLPRLEMGIGINTGEVVVGNIGSEKRTKYGVVGNQVNLAYRIESYTIGGQIIISETTLKEAGEPVQILSEKEVSPKGVKQPITIYEVGGIRGDYNLFLREEQETLYELKELIPIQVYLLKGKDVSQESYQGFIVKLSAKGAELQINREPSHDGGELPSPMSNLKLNLINDDDHREDIYAKVLDKRAELGDFYIRFTNLPPEIKTKLDAVYNQLLKVNI